MRRTKKARKNYEGYRRRELGGSATYLKWTDLEEGFTFIGRYESNYIDEKFGKIRHVFIDDATGEKVIPNHCGALEYAMTGAEVGDLIELVYHRMEEKKTKNYGTTDVHQITVTVLESDDDEDEEEAQAPKKTSTPKTKKQEEDEEMDRLLAEAGIEDDDFSDEDDAWDDIKF